MFSVRLRVLCCKSFRGYSQRDDDGDPEGELRGSEREAIKRETPTGSIHIQICSFFCSRPTGRISTSDGVRSVHFVHSTNASIIPNQVPFAIISDFLTLTYLFTDDIITTGKEAVDVDRQYDDRGFSRGGGLSFELDRRRYEGESP